MHPSNAQAAWSDFFTFYLRIPLSIKAFSWLLSCRPFLYCISCLIHTGLTMLPNSRKLTMFQAVVALANEAMKQTFDPNSPSRGQYIFPVKGCMFFGVPHKGADIADMASRFLSVLGRVFNVNKNNIQDLKPKSQRFANTSSQFRSVQKEHDIPVISFFETVKHSHAVGLVSWYPHSIARALADIRALTRDRQLELRLYCNVAGFHKTNSPGLVLCSNLHLNLRTTLVRPTHTNVCYISCSSWFERLT